MTERVYDAVADAAQFCESDARKNISCTIVLLTPVGDSLSAFAKCIVRQGDENNVLSRYATAVEEFNPHFVVRITGDCPLIPSFIISKHVRTAIFAKFDYVTNADERFRTEVDGYDCEVISRKLWDHMNGQQLNDYQKEHVTPWIKEKPPHWARICNIVGFMDRHSVKLSVDTDDDLTRVREQFFAVDRKLKDAATYRKNSQVQRL